MRKTSPCPDRDALQQLVLGKVAEPEARRLEGHLRACPNCQATLPELDAGDPLVQSLRQGRGVAAALPQAELLECLMRRLRELRTRDEPSGLPPATSLVAADTAADPEEEPYDFLAPPEAADEIGRLGPYRVLKVLGRGGMGVVFEAEDPQLRRLVALKAMKTNLPAVAMARKRFLREARAIAALEHDHVVAIFQVGEDRGALFLAMPLLRGESLHDRLARDGKLPLPEALRIGRQTAEGLAAAHARGLIHRDIKPSNLWLEAREDRPPSPCLADQADTEPLRPADYRVKILDFGLARFGGDGGETCLSNLILGTPAYMAPEQARGEAVDGRADLFGLGCVLYQACTGELPFQGRDALSTLAALAADQPRPPRNLNPQVPPALSELVMQLLARDAADRPASAREVADRLQAIERQPAASAALEPSQTEVRPPAAPGRRPVRGRRVLAASAALLAVLSLGYFFGGTVIRIATNTGELVVRVDDPSIEVAVQQDGVVVHDKTTRRKFVLTAGPGEVVVYEQASGLKLATKKFTLTRGGKEYLVVAWAELAKAKIEVRDRRAAEWVLSVGGVVTIRRVDNGQEVAVARDLTEAEKAGPAGLVTTQQLIREHPHLKELPEAPWQLAGIGLSGVNQIGFDPISNASLEHIKDLPNLARLDLMGAPVSDADLAYFKNLQGLKAINLCETSVGDAGVAHLKGLPALKVLNLQMTRVGDEGLKSLRKLTRLQTLYLSYTRVGDAGLKSIGELPNLAVLDLAGTRVSDAGLPYLYRMSNLRELNLSQTNVTGRGSAALRKALPRCDNITENIEGGDPPPPEQKAGQAGGSK
jgi:serine/threonine protein kinase